MKCRKKFSPKTVKTRPRKMRAAVGRCLLMVFMMLLLSNTLSVHRCAEDN